MKAVPALSLKLKTTMATLQEFYILSLSAPLSAFRKPFYLRESIEQMDYAGVGSVFVVFLVSLFVGMALSLQIAAELSFMGLKIYTGRIVGISIIREIGPVVAGICFAGRVGAGMASEIGSMTLSHQVDVMRVFGVDPIKRLVAPRIISAILTLPMLTLIGDAVALIGAYFISVYLNHQSGTFFWQQIKLILNFENILMGAAKPFIFGYIISVTACYTGLKTRGGARGLRKATTSAVVVSIIRIIVADFVLTRIILYIFA